MPANIIDNNECRKYDPGEATTAYWFCAGVPEDGRGQWKGDSGGPLTVDGVLYGITPGRRGRPCAIYVRVSSFVNWIRKKTVKYVKVL